MHGDHQQRLEALFDAHYGAVLAYALRRTDEATAQEVAAEAFVVAWRRKRDVPDHALPWLLVVTRNMLHSRARSERRRRRYERAAALASTADQHGEDLVTRLVVLEAFASLSDADREVLMLVAWDGLTNADAALVVGCSSAAFAVRLHRARERLEHALRVEPAPSSVAPAQEAT